MRNALWFAWLRRPLPIAMRATLGLVWQRPWDRATVRGLVAAKSTPGCVDVLGLNRGQLAALRFHGDLELRDAQRKGGCPWMVIW